VAAVYPFLPDAEREGNLQLPSDLEVALPELTLASPETIEGALMTPLADGGFEVSFDDDGLSQQVADPQAEDHYANLAEHLSESQLSGIAQEISEMVKADLSSRSLWYERLAKGLELLGVVEEKGVRLPFSGASTVTHPLIAEAIVQYQARALVELFPAAGPAKSKVMGDQTREKDEQAERVADFMNYQLTFDDRTYFAESDRLLFLQPSDGSVFRKVYHDFLIGKNVARIVKAENFIVPYSATTLEDAPRYTHQLFYTQNEMRRLQRVKFYRATDVAIPNAAEADAENQALISARDDNEGRSNPDNRPEDREHCVYETVVDWDLPGFEDKDEAGEKTGVALPYVISVERDSLKVLSIRRQWRENDPMKRRRIQIVHYPFIRGDGFYGFGLFHLAAGIGRAATGLLRLILDNGAWAALQGGFKSSDAKLPSVVEMEPLKWVDTEMSSEELSRAFYTPPFKEVPAVLFQVLGMLTEMGQRFVSTTDATVGDAKNTGPVGTTVALIEQGQKVATGVHKRSHEALGQELRLLAELNGEYLPEEGYPYDVPGASRQVFRADFGPAIDVEPVSDPNIISSTQRIAIAQTGLQLADSAPDLYNRREAHRRFLTALNVPDIEALLPPEPEIKRCDAVTENAKAMIGDAIKVFPDQHHDAHIGVHYGQLQMIMAQPSASAEIFQQVMIPHIQEHEAQSMRLKMMQQMGIPLPPLHEGEDGEIPELDPQTENMISMRAAQLMQALTAQLQQQQAQAQAAPAQMEAEQVRESAAADQDSKDQAAQREQDRKDMAFMREMDRKDAMAGLDPNAVKQAQQYLAQRGLQKMIQPQKLAVVARALDASFDDAVRLLMQMRQGGQGGGPAPFAMPSLGGVRQ
jgi:hypothetical protein